MILVLFDFDGTITTNDSLIKFIRFAVGDIKTISGILLLSPMFLAFKLKIIPNYKAKQWMLSYFFKGMNYQKFQKIAEQYSIEYLDRIIRPKAIEKIKWHQQQSHKVVIVSASMECWLNTWCQKYDIDLIATQLEVRDGRLTGKFSTKNCHGIEKVNRITETYDLSQYDYIYAYGDSRGDKEMLALADESFYKPFRD